ncbi:hypothetical protein [Stappia sp. TSB10GB4]|uniref:hypothetical protein n=1 Tax=Stappia sp. TSB10GB4 TaxID=2003584 RepID=UPI001647868A|nr:hypothetical protein [Stappia sp. TSB10GB4]
MSRKRDKAYYEARLKAEHPALFADVVCGRQAFWDAVYQSGLKPRPTPLSTLKQQWRNAASAERDMFLQWLASEYAIACVVGPAATAPSAGAPINATVTAPTPPPVSVTVVGSPRPPRGASGSTIVDPYGRLLPAAKQAILSILAANRLKPGAILKEIGEKPLNPSLGSALARDTAFHDPALVNKLEAWLDKHGYSFP